MISKISAILMRASLTAGFALACAITLPSGDANAAAKKDPANAADLLKGQCDGLLVANESSTSSEALIEEYTIDDLISADPAKNLAVKHPTIVMDAAQKFWQAIKHYPTKKIKDPTYGVVTHDYYSVFSDGVPAANGRYVRGQFDVIETVAEFIEKRGSGQNKGVMQLLYGPPGTGKTETLNLLSTVVANLSSTDPDFYQFTFKWVGLEEIPYLKPLVREGSDELYIQPLQRSPFVLLPRAIQDKLIALASPKVREMTGYEPSPFRVADPQNQEILNQLIKYYAAQTNKKSLTDSEVVNILRKHVKIVRRVRDPNQPAEVVRYAGKYPDMSELLVSPNISMREVFSPSSPFAYNYNGVVARADGGGLLMDEFFRNAHDLRNSFLDIAQNGNLQYGGAPAVTLDIVPILSSNDENVEEAKEDAGSNAHLDRLAKQAMRQPIHPSLIEGIAVWMAGNGMNVERLFKMRELGSETLEQANLNKLYPQPAEDGSLTTPANHYALYFTPSPDKQILIAPRALELLSLTVAGTRLVTDPKAISSHAEELNQFSTQANFFTDISLRLKLINRSMQAPPATMKDLDYLTHKLHEGSKGISARDAERWLSRALKNAEKNNMTLTPSVVAKTFYEMIKEGEFEDIKTDPRTRWQNIHNLIKQSFTLPDLTDDISTIVSGDSGVADRIYREIEQEILEISSDDKANYRTDPSTGDQHPIDRKRLDEIAKSYQEENGEEFPFGRLQSWKARAGGATFEPLMRAIRKWLLRSQLSTTAMDGMLSYMQGQNVDESVRRRALAAESSLEKFGYNRQAFIEALSFVRDTQYKMEIDKKARQPKP